MKTTLFSRRAKQISRFLTPLALVAIFSFSTAFTSYRNETRADEAIGSSDKDEENEFESPWFRLAREGKIPQRLETSIVTYSGEYEDEDGNKREVSVALVGAIHIADAEYYKSLNEIFKEYETVVFEMVSNGDDASLIEAIEKERQSKSKYDLSPLNAVSTLQMVMGDLLGLTYQIDGIDYGAGNLVRGDMNADEFIIQLINNGDVGAFLSDSFFSSIFDREPNYDLESLGLAILFSNNKQLTFKRFMANELIKSEISDVDKERQRLDDDANGKEEKKERETALIQLRNKKAISAVKKELQKGRSRIAAFYGAAHLPDMEKRLQSELNLKQVGEPRWITAWDMTEK